jgi:hypothetical protein
MGEWLEVLRSQASAPQSAPSSEWFFRSDESADEQLLPHGISQSDGFV